MRVASLIVLSVILASCAAIPRDPRMDYAALSFADDTAYAVAASLTAEVGPRFAGTEGDLRAVQWAVKKLTELGFQNVRTEPVTVPRWQRGEIAVEIRGAQPRRLQAIALGGSAATPEQGIEAPIVAVGSVKALEQLPDAKVRGRIVYLNGKTERRRDGTGYAEAAPMRRFGPVIAGRKGAVAALVRSLGTEAKGPAHTGRVIYEDNAPKVPAAALSTASADLLDQALKAGPVTVRLALGSEMAGEAQSANVIGEIPGETNEIVLLGAHLDSWDNTPGANDDAAGVGIVMAAAKRVAALGHTPKRTLRVVLFANEEFGATGAKAYAAAHADELPRHMAAIEADSGSGAVFKLAGYTDPNDWRRIQQLAKDLDLELGQNYADGHIDVEPLRKLGVPELIATQDATHYFDVHHTGADSVDTLDRDGLVQATGVYARIAHFLSEWPERFERAEPPVKR